MLMTEHTHIENAVAESSNWGPSRNWVAELELSFKAGPNKTHVDTMRFVGPLRVQRPFYPEGACCHSYILHPPGGMVSGDKLGISVTGGKGSRTLITTPSAGKVYGTDSHDLSQQQHTRIVLDDARLEYLPQETIIFNGARAELHAHIEVNGDSSLVYWDMIVLGRVAGAEPFEHGSLMQSLRIERDGKPLVSEHLNLLADSSLRTNPAGLQQHDCFGACYWVCDDAPNYVEALRESAAEINDVVLTISHKPGVLIIRALAHCAEQLRNALIALWQAGRPLIDDQQPVTPRIWST